MTHLQQEITQRKNTIKARKVTCEMDTHFELINVMRRKRGNTMMGLWQEIFNDRTH